MDPLTKEIQSYEDVNNNGVLEVWTLVDVEVEAFVLGSETSDKVPTSVVEVKTFVLGWITEDKAKLNE